MAENKPHFLNMDGSLSGDGKALVEYVESQFVEADQTRNVEKLNALPGMVGHYYVNVFKTRAMTPEAWIKEYPNAAHNAWANKVYMESQQQQAETVAETANKTDDLAAQLNALKESLAAEMNELRTQLAARDAEIETLKAGKGKKAAKVEPETPSEDTPAEEA